VFDLHAKSQLEMNMNKSQRDSKSFPNLKSALNEKWRMKETYNGFASKDALTQFEQA